ncbi:hypothetical protein Cantr_03145 [Candida viswanathii]|uniref:Uncharacterized protein n=1 Tax=Candida viswanathii TaxID=5486 RepID=A0A367YL67_9ASCO|nr:hypothetical protein Cantr_03145 [Candida viswanathii]
MLRIFTFDKKPLPVLNERFAYALVDDDKDIEDALKVKPPIIANDEAHVPLYVRNYAVVKHGIIEMRSIKEPGEFIIVESKELADAAYQYYRLKYQNFFVFYREDSDLEYIRGKIDCVNSQSIFKKCQIIDRHYTNDLVYNICERDKLKNRTFYFVDPETKELRMGTAINGVSHQTVLVDKITSPPLSSHEVIMSIFSDVEVARRSGPGDLYNWYF